MAIDQGKVGEVLFSSRSGKSQGILHNGQENLKYQNIQEKVMKFPSYGQNCLAVAGILSILRD